MNVAILNVIKMNVVMLSVFMPNVIITNAVAQAEMITSHQLLNDERKKYELDNREWKRRLPIFFQF